MTAGELRERIRFDRRLIAGDDGYGNVIYAWQTIAGPLAARIDPGRGSEAVLAQRITGIAVYDIKVRWCAAARAIETQDRAVNERTGEEYNVTAVTNDDETRHYMNITATTGEAAG
jgi:SPP1 family predicted phage head-tail adaptor